MICDACKAGPAGIGGHGGLLVHTLCAESMAFNCATCRTLWTRSSHGKRYIWSRIRRRQRLAGVHIPQRRDAAF